MYASAGSAEQAVLKLLGGHAGVRFEPAKTLHATPANDTLGVNVSFERMQDGYVRFVSFFACQAS